MYRKAPECAKNEPAAFLLKNPSYCDVQHRTTKQEAFTAHPTAAFRRFVFHNRGNIFPRNTEIRMTSCVAVDTLIRNLCPGGGGSRNALYYSRPPLGLCVCPESGHGAPQLLIREAMNGPPL